MPVAVMRIPNQKPIGYILEVRTEAILAAQHGQAHRPSFCYLTES
jgi:hypothetical protein